MDQFPNPLVGSISGSLIALAIWIGCTVSYGFLGFALGWMPAAIVGSICGTLIMLFWPFLLLILGLVVAAVTYMIVVQGR